MGGTHGKETSVYKAFKWGMFWHCGSVAFGSFLIALVTFIRIIFEYFAQQAEKAQGENPVVKCITCYVRYYLMVLDSYVKFISKNAFIQVALMNCSFCGGAMKSFWLIIRHASKFGAASMIGWIMMILGKGVIVGSSTYLTFLVIDKMYTDVEVSQPIVPAAFIFMWSYMVASLFLSVFTFGATAILHCYIFDSDTIGGNAEVTPDYLLDFIDKDTAAYKEKDEGFKKLPPKDDNKTGAENEANPVE
jgi:hypothetical protein